MKFAFYSVYDVKLKRFNIPFVARSDQEAVVIVLRSGIPKTLYDDTRLFKVGDFDDERFDVEKREGSDFPLSEAFSEVKLPPFPLGGDQNA